jgi:hypothetical protein
MTYSKIERRFFLFEFRFKKFYRLILSVLVLLGDFNVSSSSSESSSKFMSLFGSPSKLKIQQIQYIATLLYSINNLRVIRLIRGHICYFRLCIYGLEFNRINDTP